MMISTRAAVRALRSLEGMTARQAQHVLDAGLLGAPVVHGRQRQYDERRIIDFHAAGRLRARDLDRIFPEGVFIARVAAWRGFDARAPRADQIGAVCDGWYVPSISHVWMRWKAGLLGDRFPFIATLSDRVVFGGSIVEATMYGECFATTNRREPLTRFDLGAAGQWWSEVAGRRLSLGPGYPWKIWGQPVTGPWSRAGLV